MKKSVQLIVLGALCFATIGNAQDKIKGNGKITTEKRTTSGYDEIQVSGFFNVVLVSGTEGTISIQADENLLPYIKVEVQGNVLKIHDEKSIDSEARKNIVLTVPFEKISALSLSGSGNIKTKNTIVSPTFKAELSGSGGLTLDIKSSDLEVNLNGSGHVVLTGNADSFVSQAAGSGNVDAINLITNKANLTISGSGNMKVNCSENLFARVSGSGSIHYKGDPKTNDIKANGSGEISKI